MSIMSAIWPDPEPPSLMAFLFELVVPVMIVALPPATRAMAADYTDYIVLDVPLVSSRRRPAMAIDLGFGREGPKSFYCRTPSTRVLTGVSIRQNSDRIRCHVVSGDYAHAIKKSN
jgi:hypothetical protein